MTAAEVAAPIKSKHVGVYWNKACRKWQVSVKFKGVTHYGGVWTDEEQAAEAARNLKARLTS